MNPTSIESTLRERAGRLRDPKAVADILGQPFVLAGGAMRTALPRDYDIFGYDRPIDLSEVEWRCRERIDIVVLATTDNAVTVDCKGQTIQFCRHFKPTALGLVGSFDFSHVQAGVVFDGEGRIANVAYTNAFEDVELHHETPRYTGSEYPLSSLARLVKFKSRGDFLPGGDDYFVAQIMAVFRDIVKRGFTDEDDFCTQCAAISSSFEYVNPTELYDLLKKGGEK